MGLILFDRFLLATESERLSNEQARSIVVRKSEACFLRFAIGEASEAKRSAQSEALRQLRGIEDFGAIPRPQTKKRCDASRIFRLRIAGEAVLAFVRRMKSGITLLDVGGLSENLPIHRLGRSVIVL